MNIFSKITHLPECINTCRCLFLNSWKYLGMRIEKKISKIKMSMCLRVYLILVRDTRWQPGETRYPLTRISQTTKKVRANEARLERPRIYESIRGECFHLHSCSRIVSVSLGESAQLVLDRCYNGSLLLP